MAATGSRPLSAGPRLAALTALLTMLLFGTGHAQSNGFNGTTLDPHLWRFSSPFLGSSAVVNDALVLTSDGTPGAFPAACDLFGAGVGVASRSRLTGDFEIEVSFSAFGGPVAPFDQAFFNIYQDPANQLHIKRIRGAAVDGVQTVYLLGGVQTSPTVTSHPISAGRFRIRRTGNTISTDLDAGAGFIPHHTVMGAFTGDVQVSLMCFGPGTTITYDDFTLVSGTTVPEAGGQCVAASACMTAWWRGESGVNEHTGTWPSGTLRAGATFTTGRSGAGFALDGVNDWIDLGNGPGDFGPGNFTLDLWVRFDNLSGEQVLAEDYIENFTPTAPGWSLTKLSDNRIVFGFDGSILASIPAAVVQANRWHHVTVTRSGSAMAIYLDGVLRGSGSSTRNFQSSATLKLGHRGSPADTPGSTDNRGFFLRGAIDEVAVHNCALSASEIAALFTASCAGRCFNTPPVFTFVPPSVSADCPTDVVAASPSDAVATDDQGSPSVTVVETSNGGAGSPSSPLVLTRTWTAVDAFGEWSDATQVVTVIDDQAPVLELPGDVSATVGPGTESCASLAIALDYGAATATDNCGTASVTVSGVPEGGLFPVGETVLTWTALDLANNAAIGTQRVVVACPVGDLAGIAQLDCNGETQPGADVTVHLLHEGSPYLTTTTGAGGEYQFDNVRHGTYTIAIEAPTGYAAAPDTRVVPVDGDQVAVEPFVFTCLLSDLTGELTGTCSAVTSPLQGVTVDLYRDEAGTDVLVATAATDQTGHYRFDDLPLGEYSIGVVVPLGYAAGAISQAVELSIPDGQVVAETFTLACQPISAQPQGLGYWKHQVNVYLTGKGHAQESLADLLHYVDEMVLHFNQNLVNPVIVYVPLSANTQDRLLQLQQLLTVNKGGTIVDRAKQRLLCLLLNVASGKIAQNQVISADGATVSQAITYSHDLLVDGNPGNDETIQTICDLVNGGQSVPSGMVPTSTRMVTYDARPEPVEMAFGIQRIPNPVRGVLQVEFSLPEAGPAVIELLDVSGRLVWREGLAHGIGQHRAQVGTAASLPSGVYRLRLRQGSRFTNRSVVVIR